MKHKFSFFVAILFLSSCLLQEVETDVPETAPNLVFNAIFEPDSLLKIEVSKTNYILDSSNNSLIEAKIELFENSESIGQLQAKNKYYTIPDFITKANSVYKIKFTSTKFGSFEISDTTKSKSNIVSISETKNYGLTFEGNYYSLLKIEFTDNIEENNYYQVFLEIDSFKREDHFGNVTYINFSRPLYSTDELITDEIGVLNDEPNTERENYLFFSDKTINGQTYSLNLFFVPLFDNQYNNHDYDLIVHFHSVSQNYYNFIKTYYYNSYSSGELFNNNTDQLIYSNIPNGYGLFATKSTTIDTLKNEN